MSVDVVVCFIRKVAGLGTATYQECQGVAGRIRRGRQFEQTTKSIKRHQYMYMYLLLVYFALSLPLSGRRMPSWQMNSVSPSEAGAVTGAGAVNERV